VALNHYWTPFNVSRQATGETMPGGGLSEDNHGASTSALRTSKDTLLAVKFSGSFGARWATQTHQAPFGWWALGDVYLVIGYQDDANDQWPDILSDNDRNILGEVPLIPYASYDSFNNHSGVVRWRTDGEVVLRGRRTGDLDEPARPTLYSTITIENFDLVGVSAAHVSTSWLFEMAGRALWGSTAT
jgi:hypothetical protein